MQDYCKADLGRFVRDPQETDNPVTNPEDPSNYYRVTRPGILWNVDHGDPLPEDGGEKRRLNKPKKAPALPYCKSSSTGTYDAGRIQEITK